MTGFATVDIIGSTTSAEVARHVFSALFVPNGLPRLVMNDSGSVFKSDLMQMLELLGVKTVTVSPENHNGNLCERFHRYLNKVQQINSVEVQSLTQWHTATLFATYAWNASPID